MSTYLVTGRSGTGKSTLREEFSNRGLTTFDGDTYPNLAGWVIKATGESTDVDLNEPIDLERIGWYWNREVLASMVKQHPNALLCGSADNQLELFDMFDGVFVLTLDPEVQRQRILKRTSHDYGKHPDMQDLVLAEQKEFARQAVQAGAVQIDAGHPTEQVADKILVHIHALGQVATS